jgi:4-aminobutyrate--pyruvate transaminase
MRSNSLWTKDMQSLLHPYTNLSRHEKNGPLIISRGRGARVYDATGKDYIEGMAGLWSASLGFSEPRIIAAIKRQLDELPFYHLFNGKAHAPGIELADRLIQMAPAPMARVFFGNSGSDANDTAVKLVWYYNNAIGRPAKKKIISRQQAYHGITVAAGSLTGLPSNHRLFDLPIANILHTDSPHYYRFAGRNQTQEEFATQLAASLDRLIVAEGPDTVAAFIAEPVMGAGGVIIPPATYFAKVQEVLKRHDVLLIADEVICGFGRTGNMWGSQTYGMTPDILTCAKALSASYLPISATMISDRIYRGLVEGSDVVGTFGHGYTYSGHPVCAAAAIAALEIYDEMDIVAVTRRASVRFLERLRAFATHPLVGEVRGVGLVGAIELTSDRIERRPFAAERAIGAAVVEAALANGVVLRAMANDTISFCPPLIITDTEIEEMFDRFGAALDSVASREQLLDVA